ncbi:MAG: acyl-CoA dehydrogenase family protein [Candidatus Bathyarchaeia archaeon]
MTLLNEKQVLLQKSIREFVEKELVPKASYWDEQNQVPLENISKVAEHGLLGLRVPEKYGGQELTLTDACVVWEEVAGACSNTAFIIHILDACSAILLEGGTEEQKNEYLPAICRGEKLMAFSYSEPEGGTDLLKLSLSTKAEENKYVINVQKIFTELATVVRAFIVLMRSDGGYTLFLVDRNTPGLSVGALNKFIGATAIGNAVVYFDNCIVDIANKIGKEGNGLNIVLKVLFSILILDTMLAVGIARASIEAAIKHVKEREMFGSTMSKLQGVGWKIAEMALEVEAARQLAFYGAELLEEGDPKASTIASMAKWYATEACVKVSKETLQLFGGYGITKDYPLQRHLRDALALTIAGFPTDYHKSFVAQLLLA